VKPKNIATKPPSRSSQAVVLVGGVPLLDGASAGQPAPPEAPPVSPEPEALPLGFGDEVEQVEQFEQVEQVEQVEAIAEAEGVAEAVDPAAVSAPEPGGEDGVTAAEEEYEQPASPSPAA